jgi:ribulose-phosphate 3-epimerase
MRDRILAPSILAADFKKLGEQIIETQEAGALYLHFDVMDGLFVPSISFGMPVLKSISLATKQIKDVHLMIQEPIRYLKEFKEAGADIITVHYEACQDILETLDKIKELGAKVGISIKPNTPVSVLDKVLDKVDLVLIMTVEPGFGGQTLIPETLGKISAVKEMVDNIGRKIDIQVDGGIYHDNVHLLLEAGANVIVSGSGVFRGNIKENVKEFIRIFES